MVCPAVRSDFLLLSFLSWPLGLLFSHSPGCGPPTESCSWGSLSTWVCPSKEQACRWQRSRWWQHLPWRGWGAGKCSRCWGAGTPPHRELSWVPREAGARASRERLQWGPSPFTSLDNGALFLWPPFADSLIPVLSGCLLAADSSLPLGLLSISHVPAPSPLSALAKICLRPGRAGLCLTSSL